MAAKVFISYRRDDSQYQARMIHAAFCKVIPSDDVFMDVDSIPPGANFRKILKDWVDQCEVLLALIGPGWIDARDPKTKRRRLDNPSDFVRIEIGEALARDIPVVPVLIDGTPMPDIGLLPDDLKGLVDRQAEFVEYRTFDADVERLIRKLGLSQGVGRTGSLQQPNEQVCDEKDIEISLIDYLADEFKKEQGVDLRKEFDGLETPERGGRKGRASTLFNPEDEYQFAFHYLRCHGTQTSQHAVDPRQVKVARDPKEFK